jgi:dTDP-4-dehydrorhamnose 3,5-epimerase
MQIIETGFEGLVEIVPSVFSDDRGWFFEFFKEDILRKHNVPSHFPQENMSFSKKGVVRGMHFQRPPYAQGKLVSVIKGRVLDVAVDMRPGSATFGQTYYCELDDQRHNMLMVPEGFAHGFAALEETIFLYKCTNVYNKEHEGGIVWNDPELKMKWPFSNPIVSEKDLILPTFAELLKNSVTSQH